MRFGVAWLRVVRLRGRVVARRAFFALRATHFCAPASRCPPIPLRAESFLSWPQPFLSIACRVWSIAQLLIVTPCHSPTDLALPLRCAPRLFPAISEQFDALSTLCHFRSISSCPILAIANLRPSAQLHGSFPHCLATPSHCQPCPSKQRHGVSSLGRTRASRC